MLKKNILIVCATSHELRVVKQELQKCDVHAVSCSFFCCGIGMYAAVHALTKKLTLEPADFVLNIGICGYNGQDVKNYVPTMFVQVARTVNAYTHKELLPPPYLVLWSLVSLLCSETPVHDPLEMQGESYVDMESRAIEYVCQQFRIPRLLLKVPFDDVSQGKPLDYSAGLALLQSLPYGEILEKIGGWK